MGGVLLALMPCETENAVANGDTRTIQLYHAHTHESITATFLVNGSYDQGTLEKLNWFLRDWRRDEPTKMDPKLFDTIWEVYRDSGSRQPIEVMSAYRSPETNAMLRRRSRAVAEHSQHILGKAMDQHYVDVPMSRIREIAMRLQRGGVGFYPTAGTPFVHMDVGGVRHWPRMSYDQLARLFPDGKTVHIPSNGQPLPGYELARAELETRGGESYPTASQIKSKGFFAWLFGGGDEDDDASEGGGGGRGRRPAPPAGRNTQIASINRSSGGVASYNPADKDGGARSFFASQQFAPPAPVAQETPRPAPEPAPATAEDAGPAPSPQATQALAAAMRPAPAADNPPVQPARVPELAISEQTLATNGLVVPVPPRRPTELASLDLPMPPVRPAELSRPIEGPAPLPRSGRGATLARSGLPAVITQGGGPGAGPQILAYSAGGRSAGADIPLPVIRPPELVLARLDRGNFRVLTSATKTDRTSGSSGFGAAVGARAAARATGSGYGAGGVQTSFGVRATDLAMDRFSGQLVKGQERLVTAHRAEAATNRPRPD